VSLLVLLAFHSTPSFASEEIVFGPKDLKISWFRLHISLHTFPVAEPGQGKLMLSKKTPEKRIEGGFVLLNNQLIGLHDLLQGKDETMERKVSLRSTNYLVVFLRGAPGATLSIMVRKAAAVPPPEVTFWAAPQTITLGETSTLAWTTTHADSAEIEPDLGEVSLSGSHAVSPERTTTYTLTATGPGGTTTKRVSIEVGIPTPMLTLSADPEIVTAGKSSMLSWNSMHGEVAVLEPGIGFVALNGTVQVQPEETTTYTITVTGPGGEATATATVRVTVISTMAIEITSPGDGNSIARPDVMVRGIVHNAGTAEVGVTVNGVVALVHGEEFAANGVPLEEGENVITAVAVDGKGNSAETSVTVYAWMAQDAVRIFADPDSGISPFETTLRIESSFDYRSPMFSYTGPGEVEIVENIDGNGYIARVSVSGLYTIAVEVADNEGRLYNASLLILAIDGEALDGLLKEKWNGMKEALGTGDVQKALGFFHSGARSDYEDIFDALGTRLTVIAAGMREIEPVYFESKVAKYRIKREETVRGQTYDITYYVYFLKDLNGLWQIQSF